MSVSNKFTLARIISAPILFALYFLPEWVKMPQGSSQRVGVFAATIVLLACVELTDFFDGFFARRRGEVSDFGKMFDPFADVFLHLSMFTCFVFSGYMNIILYVLILYREFSQSFLRMVAAKSGTAIAAKKGGKVKTVFYVASCFFALLQNLVAALGVGVDLTQMKTAGNALFAVCVFLSYASFADYLKTFVPTLKEKQN